MSQNLFYPIQESVNQFQLETAKCIDGLIRKQLFALGIEDSDITPEFVEKYIDYLFSPHRRTHDIYIKHPSFGECHLVSWHETETGEMEHLHAFGKPVDIAE